MERLKCFLKRPDTDWYATNCSTSLGNLQRIVGGNIETVTFDCPRFWDGHDMSQMKIYINYMRPNETTGQYLAKNIQVSGNRMTFDWTISRNVSQYKGKLSILVCIKKTDAAGDEENHWNSELNQDLYVSEGLECSQTVASKYPDIITQLLTRMDEVEAIATPEAMQAYAETWLEENHNSLLGELTSPDGTVWNLTVANDGTLTAVKK